MTSVRLSLAGLFLVGFGAGQTAQAQSAASDLSVQSLLNPSTNGTCTINGHRIFTPGISLKPSRGTFVADTVTQLHCIGKIDGVRMAGPAHLDVFGDYGQTSPLTPNGDTCVFGSMSASVTAYVDLVDGRTIIRTGSVQFKRLGMTLTAEGTLGTPDFGTNVVLEAIPDVGQDCVTVPLTGVTIVGLVRIYAP